MTNERMFFRGVGCALAVALLRTGVPPLELLAWLVGGIVACTIVIHWIDHGR